MQLNGIDIASWQAGLVVSKMTTTDFVIVKATEDDDYINPYFAKWAADTLACKKLLGCYHFARPNSSAATQANYFVNTIKKYLGKAVLFLDWEEDAVPLGPSWAKAWCDQVYKKTGSKPMIYMSKSVCNAYNWSACVKAGYGLWVAQYPDYNETGFLSKPWTDSTPFGAWKTWDIFQYTSSGRVAGYSGRLDLNLYKNAQKDWNARAAGSAVKQAVTKVTATKTKSTGNKIEKMVTKAIAICNDDSHGYSQYRRWGDDFDCSSLMYYCADYAGYGIKMTDPRWTGSMIEDFTRVGFKKIKFDRSSLKRGDILLSHNDERQHTEIYIGDGKTAGAHIAETGGIDGQPGDQTGNEISVQDLWWTPDWVLRPPADAAVADKGVVTDKAGIVTEDNGPEYRVMSGGKWHAPMFGTRDSGGTKDNYAGQLGKNLQFIAIKGVGKYRVFTQGSGWLPWVTKYDPNDLDKGCAGDGTPILAIEIPNSKVKYAAHNTGGKWNSNMIGNKDTGGSSDKYAGAMVPIDALRVEWAK